MLWKSPVVLMFFWCVTLSLFTVTVSDGAGTLAGALGEAVPEPGPVPAAGDGSSESRQFSAAPSVTNVTTSSVSPTAMTTAAPKSREATTTSHPSSAVIFGDDAKPHLNPSNMTEEVFNFIDEEEAPQDALTLALYMLASVLVVLAICMIFSYCKRFVVILYLLVFFCASNS
jgi:hypothetical protein